MNILIDDKEVEEAEPMSPVKACGCCSGCGVVAFVILYVCCSFVLKAMGFQPWFWSTISQVVVFGIALIILLGNLIWFGFLDFALVGFDSKYERKRKKEQRKRKEEQATEIERKPKSLRQTFLDLFLGFWNFVGDLLIELLPEWLQWVLLPFFWKKIRKEFSSVREEQMDEKSMAKFPPKVDESEKDLES